MHTLILHNLDLFYIIHDNRSYIILSILELVLLIRMVNIYLVYDDRMEESYMVYTN